MLAQLANQFDQPFEVFAPYPAASDRAAWNALPDDLKSRLIANGESWLGYRFPSILATDFMEFCRNGNRSNYESRLFSRRTILDELVLAECVENQGRFLDDILNAVFLICEESAWQLPAHNSYIRDTPQLLLPDVTRPVVDLFAAETGAVLAVTEYLLRDAFAAISPAVSIAINDNLNRRIFTPYLSEYFWWMGNGREHVNNWTSWCTQNVLLAAFTRPLPEETQSAIFRKACESLDYFLEEYGDDGCCDEGAQYYRHAGLTLFNALEVLNTVSGHALDCVYREKKIYNIADYIRKVHVHDMYYVNFADCSPIAGRCNAREYLFGKRTGNPELMAFAAADYQNSEDPLTRQEHSLFYRLQTIFNHEEMLGFDKSAVLTQTDVFYPSVELFYTRDDRYALAVKGGDNDDSHNHNDVGSFTIYKDGQPLFIDVGVETYTRKTFSSQRYELWPMQSRYHNLPAFDGIMQMNGPEYRASQLSCDCSDTVSQISMEISGAYPAQIGSYQRQAVLEKGKGITIHDTYDGPCKSVVLSLMTYEKPEVNGAAAADSGIPTDSTPSVLTVGNLGTCRIKGASRIEIEEIPITDPRLALTWKHSIYRTLVTLEETDLVLDIQ